MLDEHEQVVAVIASGYEESSIQVGGSVGARPGQFVKRLLIRIVIRKSGLPSSAGTAKVKVYGWAVMAGFLHSRICKMKRDEQEEDTSPRHI